MEESVGSEDEGNHDEVRMNARVQNQNISHTPTEVASIPLTDCPFTDLIFKELSVINGQINAMKRKDLVNKLKKYHLNHKGDIMVLRKRLKNHFKVTKLTKAKLMEKQNLQPYYVVIDFEATCQENNPVDYKYEIIEFPAILIHTETLKIVDVFHSYVKPVIHPQLTGFCKQLTGITQEEVDKAPKFPRVLKQFESWLSSHGLLSSRRFIVTDGPWDMGRFLFLQCKLSGIPFPAYAREWTNLRKIFRNFYSYHQGGCLEDMVKYVGLVFEGEPHRGLDDSYNIARMFIHLLRDGALIRVNERITNHCRSHNNMHVIPVSYKKKLNTQDDVASLRSELAGLNLSLNTSDTEPSEDESANPGHPTNPNEVPTDSASSPTCPSKITKVTENLPNVTETEGSDTEKADRVDSNTESSRSKPEGKRSKKNKELCNTTSSLENKTPAAQRILEILQNQTDTCIKAVISSKNKTKPKPSAIESEDSKANESGVL
ncbi:hypothetical protein M8J77_003053 [Diaphorina citri]|nr:hypothetical protein M8J77_003053 [Diaphorina citri]